MKRLLFSFVCIGMLGLAAACDRSAEADARADRKVGELMPAAAPGFDPSFVGNQAEAKVLPEREISYEPLESFRAKNAEAHAKMLAGEKASDGGEKHAAAGKGGKHGKKKKGKKGLISGLIGKAEGLLGVKAKPAAADADGDTSDDSPKEDSATKEDADDSDDADADDSSEEDGDDEADSDDADSDDDNDNADSDDADSDDDGANADDDDDDDDSDSEDEDSGDDDSDSDDSDNDNSDGD